jgi:hypothetical protein
MLYFKFCYQTVLFKVEKEVNGINFISALIELEDTVSDRGLTVLPEVDPCGVRYGVR